MNKPFPKSLTSAKLRQLMKVLIQNKDVHSQPKYDKGEIKQKFNVEFLSNSNLAKQQRGQKLEGRNRSPN